MQDTYEDLSWDDVRLFLALARSRTLGAAGEMLGLDTSTMSRRLDALEDALSTTLFERGRRGIGATEAAEQLLPVAEEMELVMARFTGTAEAFEREVAGRVRVACPADAAHVFLVPLLAALRARHPRLCVDLDVSDQVVDMARRAADLALRTQKPKVGDLLVTRLLKVGWCLAASVETAKAVGVLRAWRDVPWVTGADPLARTTAGKWYARHLDGIEPVLRADNLATQITGIATGLGVGLVPARSVAHYGLSQLKLGKALKAQVGTWPEDDLFLVSHRTVRNVPRIRAVHRFLVEQAR